MPAPPISARLQPAIKALLSDDEATGERLLREAVDAEPTDVNGWLWMATLACSDENHTKSCLERALLFNSTHRVARHLLDVLQSEQSGAVFPELTFRELVDAFSEPAQMVFALRILLNHLERLLSLKPDVYTRRHTVSKYFGEEVDLMLSLAYKVLFHSKELAFRPYSVNLEGLRQAVLTLERVAALVMRLELCQTLPENQTIATLDEVKCVIGATYEVTDDFWAKFKAWMEDPQTKLALADKRLSES